MCGVAGFYGRAPLADARLESCLALMGRRGPDGAGRYAHAHPSGGFVHLLHSRLAILDPDERAGQPMRRGGHALAVNGELYNYLELCGELEKKGERFATACDAEVLLALLAREEHAVDPSAALDACEGMWAFALYDEVSGELILCRDRFGEKPLYLWRRPEGLYFGSEVKFLAALAGVWPEPDAARCLRFLAQGYKSIFRTAGSWFSGVFELAPGSWLGCGPGPGSGPGSGKERGGRYWRPAFGPIDEDMGFDEAARAVREALVRSMDLRLRSDVPLAFCLSGGVDSTVLASLAARRLGHKVHAFTVVDGDPRYDERAAARLTARRLGAELAEVELRHGDFLDDLALMTAAHDGPVATVTSHVQWLLYREVARAGFRVSVSGVGADELFTGYYDHFLLHLASFEGDPAGRAAALSGWERRIAPNVRNPVFRNPDRYLENPWARDHVYDGAEANAARLARPFGERFAETPCPGSHLRIRMQNELFCESVPVILREDDLNAMYWSVENRSPYLDRGLAELCWTIPDRNLVRDGFAKAVLREAARGIAPDAVLDDPVKKGFNASINSLADFADPETRARILAPSPLYELVRREAVRELLGRGGPLPNADAKFLFAALTVKCFLEGAGRGAP